MEKTIAVLAGDGIGPEIMAQALRVLDAVAKKFNHQFTYTEGLVGGAAWDEHKSHFPAPSEELCKQADAVLFGSVGGPLQESHLEKWQNCEANSILAIRKAFGFNANFRPARVYPQLRDICPLKDSVIGDGVDLLIIRELVGDIYFGEHKLYEEDGMRKALDVAEYDEDKIRNIAHTGFQAARKRRKRLHSVDKANVLSTSKLWREVVSEVAKEYGDVEYSDILVDNCAMQIIRDPGAFDVVLAPNMFGDILSDAAAVLPGSLGLTPSASLNPQGLGLYEPSGGSAPDIAGKGIANPIAQILSAAMMLQFSFSLVEEATLIEKAVDAVLDAGIRTIDIASAETAPIGTAEFTDHILQAIEAR
jgi:3-isopropylmalate dehydrogenase